MISATGLSLCFILASILLSIGTRPTAFGATAMVFIFQIFLGIGYLPIVSIQYTKANRKSWQRPPALVVSCRGNYANSLLPARFSETLTDLHDSYSRTWIIDIFSFQLVVCVHGCSDYSSSYSKYQLESLHHIRHLQRFVGAVSLSVLPRNESISRFFVSCYASLILVSGVGVRRRWSYIW